MRIIFLILSLVLSNLSQIVNASHDKQIWDIDNDIKRQLFHKLERQSITIEDVQTMAGNFDLSQELIFRIFFNNNTTPYNNYSKEQFKQKSKALHLQGLIFNKEFDDLHIFDDLDNNFRKVDYALTSKQLMSLNLDTDFGMIKFTLRNILLIDMLTAKTRAVNDLEQKIDLQKRLINYVRQYESHVTYDDPDNNHEDKVNKKIFTKKRFASLTSEYEVLMFTTYFNFNNSFANLIGQTTKPLAENINIVPENLSITAKVIDNIRFFASRRNNHDALRANVPPPINEKDELIEVPEIKDDKVKKTPTVFRPDAYFNDVQNQPSISCSSFSSSSNSSSPASVPEPDIKILYTSPKYKNDDINQNQVSENKLQPNDFVDEKAELVIRSQALLQEFDNRRQSFIQECINGKQTAKIPSLKQQPDDTDYLNNQKLIRGRRNYEQHVKKIQHLLSLVDQSDRDSLSSKYMQHIIMQSAILDKLIGKCIKDYQTIPDSITNLDQCIAFIKNTTNEINKTFNLYNIAIVNNELIDFYFDQLFMARKQLEIGLYTKSVLEASLRQNT